MQTKYLTVTDDLKVKVWAYNDTFPEGDTFIGQYVHDEALDPFGMVLYPKLQEFAVKRLRELAANPEAVNVTTVELIQAYGDNFVKATESPLPETPAPISEPEEEEEVEAVEEEQEEEPTEEEPVQDPEDEEADPK